MAGVVARMRGRCVSRMKGFLLVVAFWMTLLFLANVSLLAAQHHHVTQETRSDVIHHRKLQQQQQPSLPVDPNTTAKRQDKQPSLPVDPNTTAKRQDKQPSLPVDPNTTAKRQDKQPSLPVDPNTTAKRQDKQPSLPVDPNTTPKRQDKQLQQQQKQKQQQHQQQQRQQQQQQRQQISLSEAPFIASESSPISQTKANENLQTNISSILRNTSQNATSSRTDIGNNTQEATGTCSQAARVAHIHEVCESFPRARDPVSMPPKSLLQIVAPNILVSDQFAVLFCINWKTGSSSLKSVLLNNSHLTSFDEAATLTSDLRPLSDFPLSGVRYRLRHYFNVIMVRHPFDRLVSAYNDKLNMDADYRERLGQSIILKYGLNVTDSDFAKGRGVAFDQFLRFILDGEKDGHWAGYGNRCFPCQLDYQYVLRTESMERDLAFIIDKKLAGKGHRVKENHYRPATPRTTRQLAEYAKVPTRLVDEIGRKYSNDMALFGYSIDTHRNGSVTANCEVPGAQCC